MRFVNIKRRIIVTLFEFIDIKAVIVYNLKKEQNTHVDEDTTAANSKLSNVVDTSWQTHVYSRSLVF